MVLNETLARYGARLTDEGFIAQGDKVLSVRAVIEKKRLKLIAPSGSPLASYSTAKLGQGISDFVQKFWFWKPMSP